jgi:hypothetical protein
MEKRTGLRGKSIQTGLAVLGLVILGMAHPAQSAHAGGPTLLSIDALDAVSAAGTDGAFTLDPASLALLQSFLATLQPGAPTTVSVSQSAVSPTVPLPQSPPPLETLTPPAPEGSIIVTASATACCGPTASASTYVSSFVSGDRIVIRDGVLILEQGRVTSTSKLTNPPALRLWLGRN